MRLQAGERLDRYRIVSALGEGAFSETYLAEDASGGRVVLKVPHPGIMGDPQTFERFRRELSIARDTDHPGIRRSLDRGETRSIPYIVFEYLDATDLRSYLKEHGPLPIPLLVDFGVQLLDTLQYLHDRGVVHRDLKPENILVTGEGRLKIADFGLALAAGARRLTWRHLSDGMGTPYYMAPEQIQGERGDARTDLYSLGVMLYELATGRPPFEADHYLALMNMHMNALPKRPRSIRPDLPPAIEAVILRLMRKRSEERYRSASEAARDLAGWEQLDPTAADPGEDRPLTASVASSSAGVWRLVALVAVAFLAAVAIAVTIAVALR